MSEQVVKRYDPFGYDGMSALMHEDAHGDWVRGEDYDALCTQVAELQAELEAARGLLAQLRGMINCTVENDTDKMPVWISTKHPVIEQIDAFLTATPAPEVRQFDKPSLLKDCNVTYSNSSRPLAEQGERQEAIGKVLSEEEMGIGYDRKVGPVIWFGKPKPGFIYTTPQPGPDVRGLVRAVDLYLAVVSDRSASSNAISAHRSAMAEALAAHRQAQQGEQP